MNAQPTCANDINPEDLYCLAQLDKLVLARGRFVREALKNDPLAPRPYLRQGTSVRYRGADILAYLSEYETKTGHEAEYQELLSEKQKQFDEEVARQKEYTEKAKKEAVREAVFQLPEILRQIISGAVVLYDITQMTGRMCGIYFLINDGEIVYVGQSVNVFSRVSSHAQAGKQFTSVKFLPCEPEKMNEIEGLLIRLLSPKLNGNDGPYSKAASLLQSIGLSSDAILKGF